MSSKQELLSAVSVALCQRCILFDNGHMQGVKITTMDERQPWQPGTNTNESDQCACSSSTKQRSPEIICILFFNKTTEMCQAVMRVRIAVYYLQRDNKGFHWLTGTKLFRRSVDILTFGQKIRINCLSRVKSQDIQFVMIDLSIKFMPTKIHHFRCSLVMCL